MPQKSPYYFIFSLMNALYRHRIGDSLDKNIKQQKFFKKMEKVNMDYFVYKIWQILKVFVRSFHLA